MDRSPSDLLAADPKFVNRRKALSQPPRDTENSLPRHRAFATVYTSRELPESLHLAVESGSCQQNLRTGALCFAWFALGSFVSLLGMAA